MTMNRRWTDKPFVRVVSVVYQVLMVVAIVAGALWAAGTWRGRMDAQMAAVVSRLDRIERSLDRLTQRVDRLVNHGMGETARKRGKFDVFDPRP